MLQFGIDRVTEFGNLFSGRCALITSPSGQTADGTSSIDALREVCDLSLLLAPEHGVRGDKAAGELFEDGIDGPSGLPTMSLYSGSSKRLPQRALDAFDTLIYDNQDVGCRYFTFISTLKNALEDCAAAGKRLIILDRPDPLGSSAEGTVLRKEVSSFVGCMEIPVRYGLSCGEFALWVDRQESLHSDLQVVPCAGLSTEMMFPDWDRPWVIPSPGLPAFENALLYPGTCLIEGTNCSEGRGTESPFTIIGAPYICGEKLSDAFNALGLTGVTAVPLAFTPAASKHQGVPCEGIRLRVSDIRSLRPVELGIRLLTLLKTLYPEDFAFLPSVRKDGLPFISLLAGHRGFEADWDAEALIQTAENESRQFAEQTASVRLYSGR